MYVCMYVCIYVCMYVCMYVCIYVCMYICMYVCMYVCIYIYVYIHIYIYAGGGVARHHFDRPLCVCVCMQGVALQGTTLTDLPLRRLPRALQLWVPYGSYNYSADLESCAVCLIQVRCSCECLMPRTSALLLHASYTPLKRPLNASYQLWVPYASYKYSAHRERLMSQLYLGVSEL